MEGSSTLTIAAVGFIVGLPVVVYGIVDLARIPAHLYRYTPYSRRRWVLLIIVGYACFGVGGIFMTVVWIRSTERLELRDDLALDTRWERRESYRSESPNHPAIASASGPVPRAVRRRERKRRHRWAIVAFSLPALLAIAAAATRVR
ncbi:MAG: hypothetical protein ACXVIM_11470 [Acidimicrobiia bacterium]